MKTIREWLYEGLLREHYKILSKYNPLYDWDTHKVQSLHSALARSTLWAYTQEGRDFWNSIYEDICCDRYIKHSNNIFLKL